MTGKQASKLQPGDEVFVAECHHNPTPSRVFRTTVRGIDPRARFVRNKDAVGVTVRNGSMWSSDHVHLTEEDAKADIRVILAMRIETLKAELAKWF
jgi:hypothetical protein